MCSRSMLLSENCGRIDFHAYPLPTTLYPTYAQVDKLVRVRRLLDRLGFLNELPERLEVMIRHRHYKEAVQLYNKTISVLTRHSHVLSFKKIKVSMLCVGDVLW